MTLTLTDQLAHSRTLILDAQTSSGAYPACENFSAYKGFCWFRDGSFIADGVSAVGEVESASAFFDWCATVIQNNEDLIHRVVDSSRAGRPVVDAQMLPARFRFDTAAGVDDWWDFQLDGYGTWVWAVVAHAHRHTLNIDRWAQAVSLTVEYLVSSWNRPCYDWWEEHSEHIHISTLGCIAAGLAAGIDAGVLSPDLHILAAQAEREIMETILTQGVREGHLVKWLGSDQLDGGLSALLSPLRVIDPCSDLGRATIASIDSHLVADGGVYRFAGDTFYGGGRWPLLTCFLGLAKNAAGDRGGAVACLEWAIGTACDKGDLPEQVDGGLLLAPSFTQQWIDRWGTVATPLLWSHAMVLRLAADLESNSNSSR